MDLVLVLQSKYHCILTYAQQNLIERSSSMWIYRQYRRKIPKPPLILHYVVDARKRTQLPLEERFCLVGMDSWVWANNTPISASHTRHYLYLRRQYKYHCILTTFLTTLRNIHMLIGGSPNQPLIELKWKIHTQAILWYLSVRCIIVVYFMLRVP